MGVSTTDLEETIGRILSPYLGETMARASVRAHCQKLGLLGSELDDEQIGTLVGKLHSGLNVFVGREKSGRIVEEMMKAIETLGRRS